MCLSNLTNFNDATPPAPGFKTDRVEIGHNLCFRSDFERIWALVERESVAADRHNERVLALYERAMTVIERIAAHLCAPIEPSTPPISPLN